MAYSFEDFWLGSVLLSMGSSVFSSTVYEAGRLADILDLMLISKEIYKTYLRINPVIQCDTWKYRLIHRNMP